MLHAVLQIGQRQLVHLAVDLQRLFVALVVHPLLEIGHGGNGCAAVNTVVAAGGQHAQLHQQPLHAAHGFLGSVGVDHAALGRGHRRGRGRRRRRGRGHLGGFRRRAAQALPLLGVVIQEGQALRVHPASDLQGLVALQLVHALLELLDRRGRRRAVAAVVAALRQQAQRHQLLLDGADILGGSAVVHGDGRTRFGGHLGLGRGRGLDGVGFVQPLQRLGPRDAVHLQLRAGIVMLVDEALEIAHRLPGGVVVGSGQVLAAQPSQRGQLFLQPAHIRLAGVVVHDIVIGAVAGDGGLGRGRGPLGPLVIRLHVAVIGVIHPGKIRIHQRGEGGRHIGRGRGRFRGDPHLVGVQRGALRHIAVGVQRTVEQRNQRDRRQHQHRHGDAHEQQYPSAAAFLFLLRLLGGLRRGGRGGGFALGDVRRAVFFKEEMALARVFHALHAGAQLLDAGLKFILFTRHGHHGAVVQALGAVPGQVFADAQLVFPLGIIGGIHDAGSVLAQRAADQEAVMIHQRSRQHLNLRHRGTGIPAAMRACGLPFHILEAVHAEIFVCHSLHPFIDAEVCVSFVSGVTAALLRPP